jgi:Zn/Cd-binding protein ZinT
MFAYHTLSEITQEVQNFINEYMNYDHKGFWNDEVCIVDDEFIEFVENNQLKVLNYSYDELKLEAGSYKFTISMNNTWEKWKITNVELLPY